MPGPTGSPGGRGQTITDPAHVEAAKLQSCKAAKLQSTAFQNAAAAPEESGLDAELRDLAEYDLFEDGQVCP